MFANIELPYHKEKCFSRFSVLSGFSGHPWELVFRTYRLPGSLSSPFAQVDLQYGLWRGALGGRQKEEQQRVIPLPYIFDFVSNSLHLFGLFQCSFFFCLFPLHWNLRISGVLTHQANLLIHDNSRHPRNCNLKGTAEFEMVELEAGEEEEESEGSSDKDGRTE